MVERIIYCKKRISGDVKLCRIMLISSLQNWWTVERSLVGSTPIRFRQKESQKAPQSLKSLAGLFIQVSYSPRVSLGIWIYRYFVGISDGILICWCRSPYGTRGAVEMAYRLGQLAGQVCR